MILEALHENSGPPNVQPDRWVEHFCKRTGRECRCLFEKHIYGEHLCRARYGEILMVCLLENAQAYPVVR